VGGAACQELNGCLKGDLFPALHVVDAIAAAWGALPAVPFTSGWNDVEAVRAPAEGTGAGVLAAVRVGDAGEGRVRFDQTQQVDLARLNDLCLWQHLCPPCLGKKNGDERVCSSPGSSQAVRLAMG